ncbi:MAG: hypothetical protein AB8G16_03570 [Gammaproteobacteria bacterium]
MSPFQIQWSYRAATISAAPYIKGVLLGSPTGLNMANLPPVPPTNDNNGTVTGADDAGEPEQLDASDLGFRVETDSTTDRHLGGVR